MRNLMTINLQSYSLLREIQSLDVSIKKHMDRIEAEKLRLDQINRMRSTRTGEKEELLKSLEELSDTTAAKEKELFTLDSNLKQAKTNLSSAATNTQMEALEKQIRESSVQVDALEEEILNLLTNSEEIESAVNEHDEFLQGSLETLEVIKKEVNDIQKVEQLEIDKYHERIERVSQNIPENLFKSFQLARTKHRFNNPITKIKGNSCSMCRFILDSQTSSLVELFKTIEFCGQCERLIAPLEA